MQPCRSSKDWPSDKQFLFVHLLRRDACFIYVFLSVRESSRTGTRLWFRYVHASVFCVRPAGIRCVAGSERQEAEALRQQCTYGKTEKRPALNFFQGRPLPVFCSLPYAACRFVTFFRGRRFQAGSCRSLPPSPRWPKAGGAGRVLPCRARAVLSSRGRTG